MSEEKLRAISEEYGVSVDVLEEVLEHHSVEVIDSYFYNEVFHILTPVLEDASSGEIVDAIYEQLETTEGIRAFIDNYFDTVGSEENIPGWIVIDEDATQEQLEMSGEYVFCDKNLDQIIWRTV